MCIIKILIIILILNNESFINFIIYWGLGIGDWGLGIGGWGVGALPPTPNPQTQPPS
jgi:hypothetical protein